MTLKVLISKGCTRLILLLFLGNVLVKSTSCSSGAGLDWEGVQEEIRNRYPNVSQLSTAELADWLAAEQNENPILIDARDRDEYAVSHLYGARCASSEKEALLILQEVARDHPIVVYCSVGYRSSELAERLQRRGYTKVFNLEGSIFQWANEGRPVYQGEKRVRLVHPYSKRWGQLLKRELWSE